MRLAADATAERCPANGSALHISLDVARLAAAAPYALTVVSDVGTFGIAHNLVAFHQGGPVRRCVGPDRSWKRPPCRQRRHTARRPAARGLPGDGDAVGDAPAGHGPVRVPADHRPRRPGAAAGVGCRVARRRPIPASAAGRWSPPSSTRGYPAYFMRAVREHLRTGLPLAARADRAGGGEPVVHLARPGLRTSPPPAAGQRARGHRLPGIPTSELHHRHHRHRRRRTQSDLARTRVIDAKIPQEEPAMSSQSNQSRELNRADTAAMASQGGRHEP